MSTEFCGIYTPLVTPIHSDESPDLESVRRLTEYQIRSGVHGIWAVGTSGEFASFDRRERADIVRSTVEAAAGRIPVIANASDASTRLVLRHAEDAIRGGAAAVAATPPYYYPHSQDELLAHYRAIRAAVDVPVFIYNIPQTVRVKVELATAMTLAAEGTVAGIKDSQNDLEWFRQLALFVRREGILFALFAGTRYLIDAAILAGGSGAIPSLANVFPDLCVECYECARRGDFTGAAEIEDRIIALESLAGAVAGGSRNAAILGFLKLVLARRGIIAAPATTSPLRPLDMNEADQVWSRLSNMIEAGVS